MVVVVSQIGESDGIFDFEREGSISLWVTERGRSRDNDGAATGDCACRIPGIAAAATVRGEERCACRREGRERGIRWG